MIDVSPGLFVSSLPWWVAAPLLQLAVLVGAGYANYQLREYLAPREPYYFGPESQLEFESILEAEAPADAPGGVAAETDGTDATEATGATHASETSTTNAPGDSSVGSDPSGVGGGAPSSAGVATADGGTTTDAGTAPPEAASTLAGAGEPAPTETAAPSAGGERTTVEHPAPDLTPEPAAAADSSERDILPKFMRRL